MTTQEVAQPVVTADASAVRVLIAQVPAAGGRWHQVHFNRDVIEQFFQVTPNSNQRVYLRAMSSSGDQGEEEVRPCVFSEQSNRNCKIELASRRGEEYPPGGERPVAVFKEIQARTFDYMLLLPGDDGYEEMLNLAETLPTTGRGLPRVITTMEIVRDAWTGIPL